MKKRFKPGSFRLLHGGIYKVLAKLPPEQHREHRVYLYLEAGPNSHYSGLFHAFPADISKYTLVPIKEVPGTLRNLEKMGWIVYDKDRQLVHVCGMLKRQLGATELNEDNQKGIVYYIERMPENSPAVLAFLEENREIAEFDAILEDIPPPVPPRVLPPGTPHPVTPTSDIRLQTSDLETMKHDTVIAREDRDDDAGPPNLSPNPKDNGEDQGAGNEGTEEPDQRPTTIKERAAEDARRMVGDFITRGLK